MDVLHLSRTEIIVASLFDTFYIQRIFYFKTRTKLLRSIIEYLFHRWPLYSTANDPETANDPQNGPQMILDRKWSLKSTANDPVKTWGMEWTDYKKGLIIKKKPFSIAF